MLRISLLGVLRLEVDGTELVSPSSRRARLLLAMLALERRTHSREALAARLWPEVLDTSARTSLRTALAQLRSALGPDADRFVEVSREHVALAGPEQVWTDVGELERLLAEGELDAAFEVCGKELLTGLEEDWVYERRDELRGRIVDALGRSATEAEEKGDLQAALRLTRRQAALEPVAEEPQRQLIRRLAAAGDRAAALCTYERLAERLRAELRTVPSSETRQLADALRAGGPLVSAATAATGNGAHAATRGPNPRELPTRVLTFLLTDIEGSAGLWEADREAMGAALELHNRLIAWAVEAHGGGLLGQKGEGDATLAVFPTASQAIACAAALQGALAAASWPGGLERRVRTVLHTGEAHEREGDYFGPALNGAGRLRGFVRGGTTVVSATTAELVGDRLPEGTQLLDLAAHELCGLSRAERVFELRQRAGGSEEPALEPARVRLPLPRALQFPVDAPFVGRQEELEGLSQLWREVSGGGRAATFLAGEAGIGKTRLAAELARALHEDRTLVLYGRCDEGLAVPYQPFVEALRPYASALGLESLRAALGPLAPQLGRLLPELQPLGSAGRGDPESERFALFEAIAALLEAATRERPALFVLDDLHWAAPPTLLLLRHIIRSERPLRALLLCGYREPELDPAHPLAALLADLRRDTSAQSVHMRGLDQKGVAALVRAAAENVLHELPSGLVELLHSQTAGNPFFLRELVAHLCESGAIDLVDERWGSNVEAAQLRVPHGVRQVICQRVARLSEHTRRALNAAAIAGPHFSLAVLERVLGERSEVLDALDEALAAGLLAEAGQGEYAFVHALVRQALYGELSAARRMRLHRQLGEALEALDPERHLEALARHFAQAAVDGQTEKATAYALAAGRRATARLGYEEAAAHYERGLGALELTERPDEERRCDLLLALGEARWSAGELGKAREAYGQAGEFAERRGSADQLARAALGFAGPPRFQPLQTVSEEEPVVAVLERALAALGEEDSALRARLTVRLAWPTRRPALARQALEMARRVGDKAALADVLGLSYWAMRSPDNLDEHLRQGRELARLAAELGERRLEAWAHASLSTDLLELGDIEAVERELEELERLAGALPDRYLSFLAAVAGARRAFVAGRLEESEALAHQALSLGLEGQDEFANQFFKDILAALRREQGRLGEVLAGIENISEQHPYKPVLCSRLAMTYAHLDRSADARRELEALATTDFSDLPTGVARLLTIAYLSEVVAFLDDAPRAKTLYELLLPYANRCVVNVVTRCEGSASRPLGLLATTMSRFEEAARHFEDALEMNAQIRSPLWVAHTQHDYARMLLRRERPGDRDTALELLDEALMTADELGLNALREKVRSVQLEAATASAA